MDLIEAIKTRKSIRCYKPNSIPKGVLREILEVARRAPSAENNQPWEFTVITGEVLEKTKRANVEKFMSRTSQTRRKKPTGVYRKRQIAIAVQLFQLMNIGRDDKEKMIEWSKRGFRFFDAPAVIIISADSSLGEARFGIGAVSQTIALTALNYGLGTCIQRQGITYPDVIREFTGIPESKRLIICITIGYPDWDFPVNQVQSEREAIENITTWCGI